MTCVFTYAAVGGTDEVTATLMLSLDVHACIKYHTGMEHEPEKDKETYIHMYY